MATKTWHLTFRRDQDGKEVEVEVEAEKLDDEAILKARKILGIDWRFTQGRDY